MADYETRVEMIGTLAAAYPSVEVTEQTIRTYVWSLMDLPVPTLSTAIERCRDTAKFFPSIAEIRENAGAISTGENSNQHPDSCACFGTGMIVPERVDGYSSGARRCDGPTTDPNDVSML
jgi:hypothetical protein